MIQRRYQCYLALLLGTIATAQAGSSLMDISGNLKLNPVKSVSGGGVVAFVSSPGVPAVLTTETSDSLLFEQGTPCKLTCQGATLMSSGDDTTALATSCLVAGAIVLDGISTGDIEAGLKNSRHGRTLSAIFRARLGPGETEDEGVALLSKQTLVLPVQAETDVAEEQAASEIATLFAAAALESGSSLSLADLYDVKIVTYTDPKEIQSMVAEYALSNEIKGSLSAALTLALKKAKTSLSDGDNSPMEALGMVAVGNAHNKQSRTVRAQLASWKSRVARGLVVDGFGVQAEIMAKNTLKAFDAETIAVSGLPNVASYRRELRSKLQALLELGIQEIFEGQIENLESKTLKRLNAQLLKTVDEPVETVMDSNAAILRNEAFSFEAVADDLEVPTLGLTKTKVVREMTGKLNDALMSFPDSAAAKVKRMGAVKKAVAKDKKKPGQRSLDLGLDLVAVLRPDGFGSFQGYAGYQLGGNSLTFGVHNDADDPQTIAQFGGVRPPLLRVQPKLRVDVEL